MLRPINENNQVRLIKIGHLISNTWLRSRADSEDKRKGKELSGLTVALAGQFTFIDKKVRTLDSN